MPGGKTVTVLKVTRPMASCLTHWARTPGWGNNKTGQTTETQETVTDKRRKRKEQQAKLVKVSQQWTEPAFGGGDCFPITKEKHTLLLLGR